MIADTCRHARSQLPGSRTARPAATLVCGLLSLWQVTLCSNLHRVEIELDADLPTLVSHMERALTAMVVLVHVASLTATRSDTAQTSRPSQP